jgi:tRNA uridine 5-carbamoylmethylation protein Kti12
VPNVVILQGLPASGKSTRAAQLVAAGYRRVNKDDLRAMIDAGVYRSDLEPLIKAARDSIIFAAVVAGFNVVVDDLNIGGGHIERITRLVGYHASVQVEVIDTPIEVCIRRDAARPAPVGELVIRQHAKRWETIRAQGG